MVMVSNWSMWNSYGPSVCFKPRRVRPACWTDAHWFEDNHLSDLYSTRLSPVQGDPDFGLVSVLGLVV